LAVDRTEHPAPSRAGALTLLGGTLAFDFANTSSGRGWPSHQENLRAAADVVDWAEHVQLMSPVDAAWLRRSLKSDSALADLLLARALEAREDIHAICVEIAAGRVPPPPRLDSLARAHAANLAHARLVDEAGRYVWSWEPRQWPVEALLGPVVLSALTTLTQGDLARLKRCQNEKCGWVFFDTTKNRSRRWCEMEICGNRAKQKRLAARAQDAR
jgi:predicted RNA-binding Zn ribbon-like protein